MSVARTIFDVIERERLLDHAKSLGEHAMKRFREDTKIKERVVEVRGAGLFIGIELKQEPEKFVERAARAGVISNVTAKKVIRIAPPINIGRDILDRGLDILIEQIAAAEYKTA
jgi:4-aminobutyrate aminotransferase-like enzyme